MPPYDDWNKVDDEEDDELQDGSWLEMKKDVILFCIDCSSSMLELYLDPQYEDDVQTCRLSSALEAAMQIQKRKIISSPNDSVGILLFNTTRKAETSRGQGSEIKKNTFLYQPISPLNPTSIQELIQLLDSFREDAKELDRSFPPLKDSRVPMGDVFTSCNWVLRDGAPKTATKRVFLITDQDDPHPGAGRKQLMTSARTTLVDLSQAGVTVEPFFIQGSEESFDMSKFYSSVLLPTNILDDEEDFSDSSVLPESVSISRIDDLLAQLRFHEVSKRAHFSIPFKLGDGFTIGLKGYGLVTEQKKGAYKYFLDEGDHMEAVNPETSYIDNTTDKAVDKTKIYFGTSLGGGEDNDGKRIVPGSSRPFYTAEDIRSFRTLGMEPSLKLLGFKDREQLLFEDNIKHSLFVYPDEMAFAGSKRTFSALLKTLVSKDKIGLVLALTRRNATPAFCALLPQEEIIDEEDGTQKEPPGFHLIPLPFADDIREAPITEGARASKELRDLAKAWIKKITVNKGGYNPDSYPNPALAYHNEQLQTSAFHEEYDPGSFEDLTMPKLDPIHKRTGTLIKAWKEALLEDETANLVIVPEKKAGTKRKVEDLADETEVKSRYDDGTLTKLRVDQLKEFCRSKSLPVSGKKADLIERVGAHFLGR